MKFTKMQGCGNDYVYINGFQEQLENPSEFAVKISDRHFGIGSDGLILILPSDRADFCMRMYNGDGSEGMMCGNGVRCIAKYVYEYGLTEKTSISLETRAGIKTLEMNVVNGKVVSVKVDMGSPITRPDLIPVIGKGDRIIGEEIVILDQSYKMTCVSMGNPHAVVFMEDIKQIEIEKIGPLFEFHHRFPDRINTEFVQVTDKKNISMRVWERGSGETLACGTGACASEVACVLNGFTEDEVTVHLLGGELLVQYNQEENRVYMTGGAEIVFEGEIEAERIGGK